MKHRANLHVTRIFLMEQKIQKEASLLIDSLKFRYAYNYHENCKNWDSKIIFVIVLK